MRSFDRLRQKLGGGTPGGIAGLLKKPLAGLIAGAVLLTAAAGATFAWIGRSRTASGGERGIVSDDYNVFELGAVKNAAGTARETEVGSSVLDMISALLGRDYGRDALETSESDSGVICALETDDGRPLRPGSVGRLRFVILPKKDGQTFYGALNITGIKKVYDEETEITSYDYIDVADADDAKALGLLKTHILFFSDPEHTTRIDPDDEIVTDDAAEAGEEYLVTLYFEWPRTYGDLDAYVDEAWKSTHTYLEEEEGDNGYNNADQVIGERISHVIVEINFTLSDVVNAAVQRDVTAVKIS